MDSPHSWYLPPLADPFLPQKPPATTLPEISCDLNALSLDTSCLLPFPQDPFSLNPSFPPSPADSCSSAASDFPPTTPPPRPAVHVVCNAPLVAPKPCLYHPPAFIQFDLPDPDEDLSKTPYKEHIVTSTAKCVSTRSQSSCTYRENAGRLPHLTAKRSRDHLLKEDGQFPAVTTDEYRLPSPPPLKRRAVISESWCPSHLSQLPAATNLSQQSIPSLHRVIPDIRRHRRMHPPQHIAQRRSIPNLSHPYHCYQYPQYGAPRQLMGQ